MAKDIVLDVVAKANSKALVAMAAEFEALAAEAEHAGKSMDQTTTFSQHLDTQIARTRQQVGDLAKEFERSGKTDVFANLRGAQGNLKSLENIKRQLTAGLSSAGDEGSRGFFSRLTGGLANVPDQLLGPKFSSSLTQQVGQGFQLSLTNPYVLGVIATAAPVLGAAIGAAVLLGIGAAGIGAGIAGQLSNADVQKGLTGLKMDLASGFKDVTASFAKPLIDGIHLFGVEWQKLQPGLQHTFEELAPHATNLFAGMVSGIDKLAPGLEKAAVAAGPLLDDLGRWLPKLGTELGALFSNIADHSDEAEQALTIVLHVLDALIVTADYGVTIMSKLFDIAKFTGLGTGFLASGEAAKEGATDLDQFAQSAQDAIPPVITLQTALAETDPRKAAEDWAALTAQFTTLTDSANTLAQSMTDAVLNALMSVDQANLSVSQSLLNVSAALKENKDSLDVHKQAGIDDRSAILGAVQANIQQYDALIQSGIGADDATAAYEANTAALERQLRKAGLTAGQIDGLIGKYRGVPGNVNTALAVKGLTDAINNLSDLLRLINGIDGRVATSRIVTIHEVSYVQTNHGKALLPDRYGGIQRFALGGAFSVGSAGIVAGGGPYAMFGEPGTGASTEGFLPQRGISRASAAGLLSTMAGWYGMGVTDRLRGGRNSAVTNNMTSAPVINVYPQQGQSSTAIASEVARILGMRANLLQRGG